MTDAQKYGFYLPAWKRTAAALSWKGRRPAGRLPSHGHGLADALYQAVYAGAQEIAVGQFRTVREEDLRHAANWVATADLKQKFDRLTTERIAQGMGKKAYIHGARGARIGSGTFTTTETNHVVTLCNILERPDDLKAHIRWNFPHDAQRASLLASLVEHADDAYAAYIARARFGHRVEADPSDFLPSKEKLLAEWQDLPIEDLRDLQRVCIQRWRRRPGRGLFTAATVPELESQPY